MTISPIGRQPVGAVGGSGGDGSDNQGPSRSQYVRLGGGHQAYEMESSDTCCTGCLDWLTRLWRAVRNCFGGAQEGRVETERRSSSTESLLSRAVSVGEEPPEDPNGFVLVDLTVPAPGPDGPPAPPFGDNLWMQLPQGNNPPPSPPPLQATTWGSCEPPGDVGGTDTSSPQTSPAPSPSPGPSRPSSPVSLGGAPPPLRKSETWPKGLDSSSEPTRQRTHSLGNELMGEPLSAPPPHLPPPPSPGASRSSSPTTIGGTQPSSPAPSAPPPPPPPAAVTVGGEEYQVEQRPSGTGQTNPFRSWWTRFGNAIRWLFGQETAGERRARVARVTRVYFIPEVGSSGGAVSIELPGGSGGNNSSSA